MDFIEALLSGIAMMGMIVLVVYITYTFGIKIE